MVAIFVIFNSSLNSKNKRMDLQFFPKVHVSKQGRDELFGFPKIIFCSAKGLLITKSCGSGHIFLHAC